MRIGVPAEIRPGETRVAATPETVGKLVQKGQHTCIVQSNAGAAASIPDASFEAAGAVIVPHAADVYSQSDIILKVRAPEASELPLLRRGSILIGLLNPHDEAASRSWRTRASRASRWKRSRASRGHKQWTCFRRRRISPATRRC